MIANSVAGATLPVGTNALLTGATYSGRVQVIAVGNFNDGSSQVLLDTFI